MQHTISKKELKKMSKTQIRKAEAKGYFKPIVDRPNITAKPGTPLTALELQILREQYPGGFRVSAYPQKSTAATRGVYRRAIISAMSSPFNNRKLKKGKGKGRVGFNLGRIYHRIKQYGAVQPNKVMTQMSLKGAIPHFLIKKHSLQS